MWLKLEKARAQPGQKIDSYSAQDDLITQQFFSYEASTSNIPQTPPQPQTPSLCLLQTPLDSPLHTHTHTPSQLRIDVTTDTLTEFLCALI